MTIAKVKHKSFSKFTYWYLAASKALIVKIFSIFLLYPASFESTTFISFNFLAGFSLILLPTHTFESTIFLIQLIAQL